MAYDLYPAVDEKYDFPPEVRQALAVSMELRNTVIPMTTALRNNLMPGELWDGRTIANTTTDHLERYDAGTSLWIPISEAADTAAMKQYVDTTRVGRNKIINGAMQVNQRAFTSGSVLGLRPYGCDRWSATAATGTVTYSVQAAASGELPESSPYFSRLVVSGHTVTSAYAQLIHYIEEVYTLSGKTATLSFWAKSPTNLKIGIEVRQIFGTGGSTAVTIPIGSITTSSIWKRYSVTFSIPSIAGQTIGTSNAFNLTLWTSAGSDFAVRASNIGLQNGTIDIWGVQLEEGPIATAFEYKPYAAELRDCMRYFERRVFPFNGMFVMGMSFAPSSQALGTFQWLIVKRGIPTLSFPVNGAARWVPASAGAGTAGQTMTGYAADSTMCQVVTSGSFAPSAGWLDNFTIDANADY